VAKSSTVSAHLRPLLLWLWKRLPVGSQGLHALAWLVNVRFAVGTTAVIFNERGEVLLLRHTYRRAGFEWGLPGGYAKGRESLERALARELGEETGWIIAVDQLVAINSEDNVPHLTVIYLAQIVDGTFRPSDEVAEYRFSPPSDLHDLMRYERRAIEQARGLWEARQTQA
jgi:ADP-ribose pyrophosphatase YjhB (NUDIX family)